jgi:hypothetical protein
MEGGPSNNQAISWNKSSMASKHQQGQTLEIY